MWTQRAGEHWKKASKKTIIFGLEFLAVLTALVQWKEILRNHPVAVYLDNNVIRDIAISSRSRDKTAQALATNLLTLEDAGDVRAWCARVPSPSNGAEWRGLAVSTAVQDDDRLGPDPHGPRC